MPFIIDGELKGKNYTNQKIAADELIKIFDIGNSFKKPIITFERVDGVVMNAYNEPVKIPKRLQLTTIFEATYEGTSFTLRYYNRSVQDAKKSNVTKYLPTRVMIPGISVSFGTKTEKEVAIWLFLHSCNLTSPLHIQGRKRMFKTQDSEGDALSVLNAAKEKINLEHEIINGAIEILRHRLKGMGQGGVDAMQADVVRATLLKMYNSAKRGGQEAQFIKNFTDNGTFLAGLIQDAIDLNIIYEKRSPKNPKMSVWAWGANADKNKINQDIVRVENDAKMDIIYYLETHADTFGEQLKATIDRLTSTKKVGDFVTKTVAEADEKPKNVNEELFAMAQALQVLVFNRVKGKEGIYWLKEDGTLGDLLVKIKNTAEYLAEFAKFIETKDGAAAKTKIEGALSQKASS